MALDLEIVLFICAAGFVGAAIMAELFAGIDPPHGIDLHEKSLSQWMIIVPVAAFGGSYWVAKASIRAMYHRRITPLIGYFGLMISILWSFCAGVIVVEFLHLLELV